MHILILASAYPSVVRPHASIVLQIHATTLYRAGQQIGIIILPRIRETLQLVREDIPPNYTREDDLFPIYRMHYGWFPRVFPEICAWLVRRYGLQVFEQYVAEHGCPDIIHAGNTFYGGYLAAQISSTYHIPTALTEHSSNFVRGRVFLPGQKRIVRDTFRQIDWIIAVGNGLREVLREYHDEIDVLDNIVDTDFFSFEPLPSQTPFLFSAVAMLRDVKNFPLLIRAFAEAFADNPDVQLKIGGDGPMQSELQVLIEEYNMQNQIYLLGSLSHEAVRDLFQQSHVVVSSSYIETFGVTLIEALACGRPVISTRSGGPEGFITDDVGILVENDNQSALASALKHMHAHYETYDHQQIRDYAVGRFSERVIVEKLLKQYQRLIDVRSKTD